MRGASSIGSMEMSSGTTTVTGYSVEIRTSYREPSLVYGIIVDATWRRLPHEIRKDGVGVPVGYFDQKLSEHGLLGYSAAQAMRWWFMSAADAERPIGSICLETRLRKHQLVLKHEVSEMEVVEALDCRGRPIEALEPSNE